MTTALTQERRTTSTALLSTAHISKTYGGTHALDDVSIDVHPGAIHGLAGENGVGSSTLKILSHATRPSVGSLWWRGAGVSWRSPLDAAQDGVGVAHQHLALAPDLRAVENAFLGLAAWKRRDPELTRRHYD